jgi:hypothetical protein
MILELRVFIHIPRPHVDGVKGLSCIAIKAVVAVESIDVQSVDNPREAGAFADGAVNANAVWGVLLRWGVKCDGLTVAEPHG